MENQVDIAGLQDIKLFVDDFYARIAKDELLSPIFNFRLSTHWQPHLEKMYTFWNAALFGVREYHGNPFMQHATMDLENEHFDRWLILFYKTIDDHFKGNTADEAKQRALIMAEMFQKKLSMIKLNKTKPIV